MEVSVYPESPQRTLWSTFDRIKYLAVRLGMHNNWTLHKLFCVNMNYL